MRSLTRLTLLAVSVAALGAVLFKWRLFAQKYNESIWHAYSTTSTSSQSDICSNPPRDNCSFYATCLESRYKCGKDGYPSGYGEKYCQAFSTERNLLTLQGQKWMLDTMHCLQDALVPEAVDSSSTTCDNLADIAFKSHAPCYLGSGLCTLSPKDWIAILQIVDFRTLFRTWDAFEATVQAVEGCVEFYFFLVENLI
ncbi:hypothetical protein C8J56DRAFT_1093536 [Mycena floridula]|nr:hypothetical protein C8J56DRAFT_1093536 [Mycena floridula]